MKYVRVRVSFPPALRHPMHQFAVDHDGVSDYQLLHGWPTPDGGGTFLFRFDGEPDDYRAAISDVETVEAFQVADGPGDAVFVYARDSLDYAPGTTLTDALEPGLVVVLPIDFEADGTAAVSFVGPSDAVQSALDTAATSVDVEVEAVRPYGGQRDAAGAGLTDRQYEAVAAAVDLGYYQPTREASVAAVGERLGCSTSAAAERLRRAEANVMAGVVE